MCQIYSHSVQLFGIFPICLNIFEIPFKCPSGLEGLICLAYFHSLMNMYTCATFGPDRSSGLEAFLDISIYDPLTPMLLVVSMGYFLTHVHSQMNMHTCAKFGPDRSRCLAYFPHFCMCDPLTPSKYPLGLESLFF